MSKTTTNEVDNFLEENKYIFKKYKAIKKIGYGSFGNIYYVIRLQDKECFAMKTEKRSPKKNNLEIESFNLFRIQGGLGIPKLISYGHTKNYNILIETLLDKSLHTLFILHNRECSIIDVCLIGIQIIERLQWIHSKDLIYRDIKPENFLIGINDPNVIYAVDFGLCKKYRSSKTGKHMLPKYTGKFNGTLKYASPNSVKGKETSRRDDLISLGYMLIYLLKRDLPWEDSFKNMNRNEYYSMVYNKETNGVGKLFKGVANEFKEFIDYTRNLKFEQDPDYSYLTSLLIKVLSNNNLNYQKITFSWINKENKHLLGVIKSTSKKKKNSHARIIKNLEEYRLKKLKKNALSEVEFDKMNINNIVKDNLTQNSIEKISIIKTNESNDKKIKNTNYKNELNKEIQIKKSNNSNISNDDKNKFYNSDKLIYIKKFPKITKQNNKREKINQINRIKSTKTKKININNINKEFDLILEKQKLFNSNLYQHYNNNTNLIKMNDVRFGTDRNGSEQNPKMLSLNEFNYNKYKTNYQSNYINYNNNKNSILNNPLKKVIISKRENSENSFSHNEFFLSMDTKYKSPLNNNLRQNILNNNLKKIKQIQLIQKNLKDSYKTNNKNNKNNIKNKNDINIVLINNNLNYSTTNNKNKTRKLIKFDNRPMSSLRENYKLNNSKI
jgi:casein kinase I family protein HRR25